MGAWIASSWRRQQRTSSWRFRRYCFGGIPGLKVTQVIFDEPVVVLVLESEGGTHTFDPDELVVLLKRA